MIENDPDLKEACRNHFIYKADDKHKSLIGCLYRYFMKKAYQKDIVVHNYSDFEGARGMKDKFASSKEENLKSLSAEQILGHIKKIDETLVKVAIHTNLLVKGVLHVD